MYPNTACPRRFAATAILLAAASALLAGCGNELASFQDTYVPASVAENYPIKVVERPVQYTVEAVPTGLPHADVKTVSRFGQAAAGARSATPVVVSYAAGSKQARKAAEQISGLIVQQGVQRQSVVLTPRAGKDHAVTMTFARKVAETRPCGDWSENMRPNQRNESGPNFGCAVQQNVAAMVSNPEDFEKSRPMTPAMSAAQSAALAAYQAGDWTTPSTDAGF